MSITDAEYDRIRKLFEESFEAAFNRKLLDNERGIPSVVRNAINLHIATCEVGQKVFAAKWILVGAVVVSGLLGGSTATATILSLFKVTPK